MAHSLVVASLELGRVLADRGKVTFRAQGTCMFPCVQSGDILHIESRTIDQVQVGDIAVYRRDDKLFAHRVIDQATQDGQSYVVTRPDRSRNGDDGPTCGNNVLGVVTAIERRGLRMPLHPQPLRGGGAIQAASWEWWSCDARPHLIDRIGVLQRQAWYQRVARMWLTLAGTEFSFVVRVPLHARQSYDLYRELLPDEFDPASPSWQGKPVSLWMLLLRLNAERVPTVTATFAWLPPDCSRGTGWRVKDIHTSPRYRGAGLEDVLLRRAEAILTRCGMTLVREQGEGTR